MEKGNISRGSFEATVKRPEVQTEQSQQIDEGWQEMRPDVDKLVMEVEQGPEAGAKAIKLASVATPDVRVGSH